MIPAVAIIQDELAHANIAYRILEDLGLSREHLVYERAPADNLISALIAAGSVTKCHAPCPSTVTVRGIAPASMHS